MSYDAIEQSDEGRRPIELYTFFRDYQAFRFTSADRNVTAPDGALYLSGPLSRNDIESTPETARSSLKITAPRDFKVADLYRVAPPTIPITFTLAQYHEGDTEIVMVWSGRVMTVEWSGAAVQITLEPVYTSIRRVGLRRMYQRQCPHVLYGPACLVNREAFKVEAVADAVTNNGASVAAAALKPDGYFAGGFVEYAVELGIVERRFVTEHVGSVLTFSASPTGLSVGERVKIYPGCDHTLTACNDKFTNAANYGGFPYFTKKNPFGGDPIF